MNSQLRLAEVDVVPLPVANFQINTSNQAIELKDISPYAAHFHWNFGDGSTHTAQHPNHTYTNPGTYTVQLIVTNEGGYDTLEQQVLIEGVLASVNDVADQDWTLFPNPAQSNNVVLKAPPTIGGNVQLRLMDGMGKLIWLTEGGIQTGENHLNIPKIAKGLYFLNIRTKEGSVVKRLMIQR